MWGLGLRPGCGFWGGLCRAGGVEGLGIASLKWGKRGPRGGQAQWTCCSGGDPGQGPHATRALPGIDKLTEKSQVSEDGTLRSLEPASQQGSAEGSPTEEVGHGDCWDWVRLSGPFCPGLPGALASVTCSRGASTQLTLGRGLP